MRINAEFIRTLTEQQSRQADMQNAITARLDKIVQTLSTTLGWSLTWYTYDNAEGESDLGYFDSKEYATNIRLIGDVQFNPRYEDLPYGGHDDFCVPTRWLYEDFEAEIKADVSAIEAAIAISEQKSRERHQAAHQDAQHLLSALKTKLSPEEQLYFHIPTELSSTQAQHLHETLSLVRRIPASVRNKLSIGDFLLIQLQGEAEFMKRLAAHVGRTCRVFPKPNAMNTIVHCAIDC